MRIHYNRHEDASMFKLAQSYAQLEQFEKARETYQRVSELFTGYYNDRAKKELNELDNGLKKTAELEQQLTDQIDDEQRIDILSVIARTYRYKVNCYKKAKSYYQSILKLSTSEYEKERIQEYIKEMGN